MLRLVVLLCLGAAHAYTLDELWGDCPGGRLHSRATDSCLIFYHGWQDLVTWSEARKFCQDGGGDLVKIVNEEMTKIIGYYLGVIHYPQPYWIGYHDDAEEGTWTWLDEPAGEPTNYTNWAADQPNNIVEFHPEGQNCGEIGMVSDYEWNDYECMERAYFICENPLH